MSAARFRCAAEASAARGRVGRKDWNDYPAALERRKQIVLAISRWSGSRWTRGEGRAQVHDARGRSVLSRSSRSPDALEHRRAMPHARVVLMTVVAVLLVAAASSQGERISVPRTALGNRCQAGAGSEESVSDALRPQHTAFIVSTRIEFSEGLAYNSARPWEPFDQIFTLIGKRIKKNRQNLSYYWRT